MDFWDVTWEILTLASFIPRFLGLFAFGVGTGWLTLNLFNRPDRTWQVDAVLLICFFGLAGAMLHFMPGGALGAYTLGAGGALLYWGLRGSSDSGSSSRKKR